MQPPGVLVFRPLAGGGVGTLPGVGTVLLVHIADGALALAALGGLLLGLGCLGCTWTAATASSSSSTSSRTTAATGWCLLLPCRLFLANQRLSATAAISLELR